MNRQLLNEMNLIPEMGEVIVDPLQPLIDELVEKPIRRNKVVLSVRPKEMDVVSLPLIQGDKRVISVPHLPKFKVFSTVTGDIQAMDYRFSSAGRHSELWIHDGLSRIAVVRRGKRRRDKVIVYGQPAYSSIASYLTEIQRRGISLTQATDIVCNELCK